MNDITTFLTILLTICGGISIIIGAVSAISKVFNPYRDMEKTVRKHEEIIERDNQRLKAAEEANRLTLKCMLALMEHETTGNGVKSLKELKDEVQDFLLDK